MAVAFRIKFTETNSGSATTTPVLTVPTGTLSTDLVVFVAHFISASAITASITTSGSGTSTQRFAGAVGTSSYAFIFSGTGFVAGETITITPSVANRSVCSGVVYSNAAYETIGSAGTTSTTVSTALSVSATNATDVAVAVNLGIASATGRTFSSYTAGWTSRSFIQGGSSTRFPMTEIREKALSASGATGDAVGTASAALLSSTGAQVILSDTAGGGGGGGTGITGCGIQIK